MTPVPIGGTMRMVRGTDRAMAPGRLPIWAAGGLGSHLALARASARPLARHDDAGDEQLAAPDAPRLPALESAGEAVSADGAGPAQRLRVLDVGWRLGEPEFRVVDQTRNLGGGRHLVELVDEGVQHGRELHVVTSLRLV